MVPTAAQVVESWAEPLLNEVVYEQQIEEGDQVILEQEILKRIE